MGKVYNGQSKLTIELNTWIDLSTATSLAIKYTKPSGKTGIYTALQRGNTKKVYYDFQTGNIDEDGTWIFWSYTGFPGGFVPGEPYKVKFYNEGT